MTQIKICPDCKTEYNPHIEKCADCGAVLVHPEELERVYQDRKRCAVEMIADPVVVKDGELRWMNELSDVLVRSGIPCLVNSEAGCKKGCCGEKFQLMVSSEDAERAGERIADYYAEIDPEFLHSKEMLSQGRCPACSTPVGSDTAECPECGLTLLIIE